MHSAIFAGLLASFAYAQTGFNPGTSTFSPLRPPAIPLAVRSPYMSTWQQAGSDGGNGGYLAGQWPTFWAGAITGWTGMIRVDNTTYVWMGAPSESTNYVKQTAFSYTSTTSVFTMDVGGVVQMTITFMSPVTPNEFLRSSLPYSYMNVDVASSDGKKHFVQLYTDISAEWISGDRGAIAEWDYGIITETYQPNPFPTIPVSSSTPAATVFGTRTAYQLTSTVVHPAVETHAFDHNGNPPKPAGPPKLNIVNAPKIPANPNPGGVAYHQVYRQNQLLFSEINQQAEWGSWYYATSNTKFLSHRSGADTDVRGQFISTGYLDDTEDTNYRAINNAFPVFGYAVNHGQLGKATKSALFMLSLNQELAVQFESKLNYVQPVSSMWTNYFSNDTDAVEFFYNDYQTGGSIVSSFDSQVQSDSVAAGGEDYAAITTLAVRQAFGSIEYTNTPAEPWVFLKEISSDGNVNTVDIIFPWHPIALYANPKILKWVLDPLFINQEAGNWPYAFSIHDIGSSFPNATGHNDGNAEQQPLEECGNMLIMALAYAQRANDNAYLSQHYSILKQWNGYLIEEALIPANQISTDDFAGAAANQTNLAIKGIIGIEAMAQIANRTGNVQDGQNYTAIAHSYINQWQGLAIAYNANPPHTTFQYGANTTYSLLYNLFADAELGLQLVPKSVYQMQSKFYPTEFFEFGIPLDTRHVYTKVDWELFCAAIARPRTQALFISTVATWLNQTVTNFAFTDLYNAETGDYPIQNGGVIFFIARPAVGGVFSLLSLESAPKSGYVAPQ